MHRSKMAILGSMLALGSIGNAIPAPRLEEQTRVTQRQTKKQKKAAQNLWWPSPVNAEREEFNAKVDERNREKWRARLERRRNNVWQRNRSMTAARTIGGAQTVDKLINAYQIHSANITRGFTGQRQKEYAVRVIGRSVDGVKAEAEHLHRARTKHTKATSKRIAGTTRRVIEQLVNTQTNTQQARVDQSWQMWEPVGDGIWQYHIHDEWFPYFMFNTEAGELFQHDPAVLHFSSHDDCEMAMGCYVDAVNAANNARQASRDENGVRVARAAEDKFKAFCEQHGHTLELATKPITATEMAERFTKDEILDSLDEAGDENYALKG